MEGHPQPGFAARATVGTGDPLAWLPEAFRGALDAPDVSGARAMVAEAAHDGVPVGRLYVDVVRPALTELGGVDSPRARLASGLGAAIVTDLVAARPRSRAAAGRTALIACREQGIEALDGTAAGDFLEDEGWRVSRMGSDGPASEYSDAARAGSIELAVAVATGPEDALRFAPLCTGLGRLADPPVIVVCDFSGGQAARAASALGADVIARDPQELVGCATDRLPEPGHRRWGVRLTRAGDTLLLAPTGQLDATSVERLADVALTRVGSFTRLVVDLRDLAEIEADGLARLGRWPGLEDLHGVEVLLIADAAVRRRLAACDVDPPLRVVETVDC